MAFFTFLYTPRSRNAVVALKPDHEDVIPRLRHRSRNAVVALKREATVVNRDASTEAGTPWWH
jgi:hypothetical protein